MSFRKKLKNFSPAKQKAVVAVQQNLDAVGPVAWIDNVRTFMRQWDEAALIECKEYGTITPIIDPDAAMRIRALMCFAREPEDMPTLCSLLPSEMNINSARHSIGSSLLQDPVQLALYAQGSGITPLVLRRGDVTDCVLVIPGYMTEGVRMAQLKTQGFKKHGFKASRSKWELLEEDLAYARMSCNAETHSLLAEEGEQIKFEAKVLSLLGAKGPVSKAVPAFNLHGPMGPVHYPVVDSRKVLETEVVQIRGEETIELCQTAVGYALPGLNVAFCYRTSARAASQAFLEAVDADYDILKLNVESVMTDAAPTVHQPATTTEMISMVDHAIFGLSALKQFNMFPCVFESTIGQAIERHLISRAKWTAFCPRTSGPSTTMQYRAGA